MSDRRAYEVAASVGTYAASATRFPDCAVRTVSSARVAVGLVARARASTVSRSSRGPTKIALAVSGRAAATWAAAGDDGASRATTRRAAPKWCSVVSGRATEHSGCDSDLPAVLRRAMGDEANDMYTR